MAEPNLNAIHIPSMNMHTNSRDDDGMRTPLVSIIIPHYQTPDLARLCLRSIRRYTIDVPYEVIVVDNGSQDDRSLQYLRNVTWIRLIERTQNIGELGIGHKEAVDIGIDATNAPLVLAFHTDTIPIRSDWLKWHIEQLTADDRIGAVGTYKLELKSPLQRVLKRFDSLMARRRSSAENGDHRPYIRSHCALYRRALLEELGLRYNDPEADVAGRHIHYALEQNGYEARLLGVEETLRRVVHLNHGTMVMLPELGARKKSIRIGRRRIDRFLQRPEVQATFNDASLDTDIVIERPCAA